MLRCLACTEANARKGDLEPVDIIQAPQYYDTPTCTTADMTFPLGRKAVAERVHRSWSSVPGCVGAWATDPHFGQALLLKAPTEAWSEQPLEMQQFDW